MLEQLYKFYFLDWKAKYLCLGLTIFSGLLYAMFTYLVLGISEESVIRGFIVIVLSVSLGFPIVYSLRAKRLSREQMQALNRSLRALVERRWFSGESATQR